MRRQLPRQNHRGVVAHGIQTVLRRLTALGVFAVDEPVQEPGFLGLAPIVHLAPGNVGLQVVEAANVHRLDGGDLSEALDLPASESNL